jgi:hypothetical protein
MKMVAVTTAQDPGAAELIRELLEARGIEVELKQLAPTAYHAVLTMTQIEVRVPEDRLEEATGAIGALEDEVPGLAGQAEARGGDENDEEGDDMDELPSQSPPARRAIAAMLLFVFFGGLPLLAGLMYFLKRVLWR